MVPGQTSQVKNVYPSQSTVVNTEALNVGMKLKMPILSIIWSGLNWSLEMREGDGVG